MLIVRQQQQQKPPLTVERLDQNEGLEHSSQPRALSKVTNLSHVVVEHPSPRQALAGMRGDQDEHAPGPPEAPRVTKQKLGYVNDLYSTFDRGHYVGC